MTNYKEQIFSLIEECSPDEVDVMERLLEAAGSFFNETNQSTVAHILHGETDSQAARCDALADLLREVNAISIRHGRTPICEGDAAEFAGSLVQELFEKRSRGLLGL